MDNPCDREGSFDPILIRKPEFISSVTDAVMNEVTAGQAHPLEVMYPVMFFDALRVTTQATDARRAKLLEDGESRDALIELLPRLGCVPP